MSAPAMVASLRVAGRLTAAPAERVRVLPVHAELAALFPSGGLRRGSTVTVRGSTTLLFGLLAEATASGSWAAVVGLPDLGVVAAAECGVAVERVALVPDPGSQPSTVVAALLDGVDVVVVADGTRLTDAHARRLSARARHRGAVLLTTGSWPGADLELTCERTGWSGLGIGCGHLLRREVVISACGRGAAARPVRTRLLLPGFGGAIQAAEPAVEPFSEPCDRNGRPAARVVRLASVAGS